CSPRRYDRTDSPPRVRHYSRSPSTRTPSAIVTNRKAYARSPARPARRRAGQAGKSAAAGPRSLQLLAEPRPEFGEVFRGQRLDPRELGPGLVPGAGGQQARHPGGAGLGAERVQPDPRVALRPGLGPG